MVLRDSPWLVGQLLRLLRSQWWSESRIDRYQETRLVAIMRHAVAAVPYYRALGIAPDSIRRATDLARFPVLRKSDVQREPEAFLAGGDRRAWRSSLTSGTTGEPMTTFFDRASWLVCKEALKLRRVLAVTNPLFRHFVSFAAAAEPAREPRPPAGWRPFRLTFLSVFTDPQRSIAQLDRLRPQILGGFPSHFAELIAAYAAAGRQPPAVPVLFTSSEHLSDADRNRIERAFGGRVFNVYGSTEFKEIAWECRAGRYHINFETVYVETEPRSGLGQALLITGLANRAMPLLRFDLGDLGELGRGTCACGRQSPYVARIHGRQVEQLELPSGRRVSPYLLTTLIEDRAGLRKYQLVQERPERLRIDVVTADGAGPDAFAPITTAIERALGGEVTVEFRPVAAIARTRGGKHRILVRPA